MSSRWQLTSFHFTLLVSVAPTIGNALVLSPLALAKHLQEGLGLDHPMELLRLRNLDTTHNTRDLFSEEEERKRERERKTARER